MAYVKGFEWMEGDILEEGDGSLTDSDEIGYYVACAIDDIVHRGGCFYVLMLSQEEFDTLPQEIRDEL